MPFSWGNLSGSPLVTFFVGANAYTYCDDGALCWWDPARKIATQMSSQKIKEIDRVVFHASPTRTNPVRGAFLVGFNVVGTGSFSAATFSRGSMVIETSIRCILQSADEDHPDITLGEAVSIRAEFDTEKLRRLRISHSTNIDGFGVDLLSPDGVGGGTKSLSQALSDLAAGRVAPLRLGRLVGGVYTGIHTEWSHMLRGLLAPKPGKPSLEGHTIPDVLSRTIQAQSTALTVAFRQNDQHTGQYVIEFEASFIGASVPGIKCFSIRPFADKDESHLQEAYFELADKQDWYFRQRSSSRSCEVASRLELVDIPEWTLELQCLSYQSTADRLNHWTQSAVGGIKAYGGATGASFVPNLAPAATGPIFTAIYQIGDRSMNRSTVDAKLFDTSFGPDGKTVVRPLAVQYTAHMSPQRSAPSSQPVNLLFPLCETTARQPLQAICLLSADTLSNRDTQGGFSFLSKNALYRSEPTQSVRMGSIELAFGSRTIAPLPGGQTLSIRLPDPGPDPGPQLAIDAWFIVNGLLPGGQDDLPEDSFNAPNAQASAMPKCRTGIDPPRDTEDQGDNADVERIFYRPKPLLINHNNSSASPLFLQVNEQTFPHVNRTIELSLHLDNTVSGPVLKKSAQQTIVLDADPFLVAQISFPQLLSQTASDPIASWSNASADGAKWQIPLTRSGFNLTLPSQIFGEEMVKSNDFKSSDFPLPPIDFRLGPPATFAMESGPQLTAYAEVPWNLRRILGYAGQSSPGVQVNRLDYELLYGLSCDASLPSVRLAEVFAVFGAIPGRLPQELATQDPAFGDYKQRTHQYVTWRKLWAHLYQRLQARLAILEPQDRHVAGSMTIKHGMSCVIRYKPDDAQRQCSQTLGKALLQFAPDDSTSGHPYRLPYADLNDPITPVARAATAPLRGGVTWGFESRNVFCATLRNEFSTADSAAVSDMDLTALGGFGHQQASFDEGRTSIFGDASMGRTYYYKLERIGRIGVFWNKAKHVIVYERSVVPSRQFYKEQKDEKKSYGIPMLRKVEEYVEILEEERRFPDDHVLSNVTNNGGATPAQRCGCIAACVFQKGARIKVSSAWGSDVNTTIDNKLTPVGWKVPLWKRGAWPDDVYPFPKITLSMFSDFGGSSKEAPCDIANPECVCFYTDTREGTGSDTDKWVAIIGVDTVDLPVAKPVQSSQSAIVPTAGDVPIPAGFSPCTFKLLPPLRATNIVANRVSTAMAVALDSVTMMRGCNSPKPIDGGAQKLTGVISDYVTAWEQQLKGLPATNWTKTNLGSAVDKITATVNSTIATAKTNITSQWKANWKASVQKFNDSAFIRLKNQLETGTSDGSAIAGGIQQVQKDVAATIAALSGSANPTAALQQLVEEQFGAIQKVVLDASATPGVLTTLLVQYHTAATGIVSRAATAVGQLNDALNSLPSQAQDAVANLTKQILDLRSDLMATWASAGSVRPIPEMVDVADGLTASTGPLSKFGEQYRGFIDALTNAVVSKAAGYDRKLIDLKQNIKGLKGFGSDVSDQLSQLATILKVKYPSDASSPLTYLDSFRYDLTFVDTDPAKTWAGKNHQKLLDAIAGGTTAVQDAFNELVNDATEGFNKKIAALQDVVTNEVTNLGNGVTDAIDNIKADAPQALTDLQHSLNAALQNLPDVPVTPQDVANLQKAVLQFRDAQLAEAHQYVDKYLGMFRSTAVDVTSNTNQLLSLVRCFGAAPAANTLQFLPGKIGYYFQGLPTQVDLSPVTSILQQAGNIANDASGILNGALNVMHLQVPTVSLADRLVPPDLSGIRLSDIFPKFSGIDLSHLFQDINLNENGDKIRISHGTDPQSLSAWAQADVGAHLQDVPVFETGGIALRLQTADFVGQVRIDASPQGTRQVATGNILGDWTLLVLGQQAVTLAGTQLLFDSSGKLQFKVDPKNVQLPGVLNFVTQYLAPFLGGGNGLSVQVQGTQVLALLNLPIPDVSGLTSGISNLSLSAKFGVGLVGGQFQLDVGFGLSDPQKPFNIAFFILGGAGYLTATTSFRPGVDKAPACKVDFGIMASASLAIAFGPISGGVYAFVGIRAGFSTGGPGLSLTAVLLMRGQVNLAGIISASVCMELAATYDGHQLTGSGFFSISVTICWCFTLNISVGISYPIGSFGGKSMGQLEQRESNPILLASLAPGGFIPDAAGSPGAPDELGDLIGDYVAMTKGF
jgi:hypothetical protein